MAAGDFKRLPPRFAGLGEFSGRREKGTFDVFLMILR
jgi:hypothetical protein